MISTASSLTTEAHMSRVYYNKLIRDNIPNKIRNKGEECEARMIEDDAEFEQELLKKVKEEASALSMVRTREDLLDEFADLMEVLDALKEFHNLSPEEMREVRVENQQKKGSFKHRYFLHWSSDDGYRSNETAQGVIQ